MPDYYVGVYRTVEENHRVYIEAESEEEAMKLALLEDLDDDSLVSDDEIARSSAYVEEV